MKNEIGFTQSILFILLRWLAYVSMLIDSVVGVLTLGFVNTNLTHLALDLVNDVLGYDI